MDDSTTVERLIAIIEKLVDENAALRRELASKQGVTVPGITYERPYPVIPTVNPNKTTDPLVPPYTITCKSGDAE